MGVWAKSKVLGDSDSPPNASPGEDHHHHHHHHHGNDHHCDGEDGDGDGDEGDGDGADQTDTASSMLSWLMIGFLQATSLVAPSVIKGKVPPY